MLARPLIILVLAASVGVGTVRGQDIADAKILVKGNTAFACNLYGRLKGDKGNLFFSPYSISTALAMTYAGAREDTARQMAKTLRFPLDGERLHGAFSGIERGLNAVQKKGKIRLHIANSLWPQKEYPFLPDFLALVKRYYGVSVTPMDYKTAFDAARVKINAWVEEKTHKKIRDLLQPGILNALTRLVLVNAVYFKGDWAIQFDKASSKDAPFQLPSGKAVQVPMMAKTGDFGYTETDGLQVLEMPYAGNDLSMFVLLPKDAGGLPGLEAELNTEKLERWLRGLDKRGVQVFMPKFKTTSRFRLDKTLVTLGMGDAFDRDKADFSGMNGKKWLYIGAVVHQAFVDVNEEGTEAAAATAVVMTEKSIAAMLPVFKADHPFLFLIREKRSGSILFMGRIEDPRV